MECNRLRLKGDPIIPAMWQEGYAAFTVSPSPTDSVKKYIANQEAHHARYSFVDELKELLEKAGIAYEEKYPL